MASKIVRRPESGTHSAKGGKFYFTVKANMTTSSIALTIKVHVENPFNDQVKASAIIEGHKETYKHIKKKGSYEIWYGLWYGYQVVPKITLRCAGWESVIPKGTIQFTSEAPAAPTSISARKVNDAMFEISVSGTEYPSVPSDKIHIERYVSDTATTYDTNSFSDIPSSPFSIDADDYTFKYNIAQEDFASEVVRGKKYWYRACAYNNLAQKSSAYIYCGPYYTSADNDGLSGGVTATRVSNSEVTVSWAITNVALVNASLITGFDVFRTEDGGPAKKIGTVAADTAHTQYTYTDKGTGGPTADHVYTYKVKSVGSGDEAETFSEESAEVYMSPTAPQSVSAAFTSGGDVIVTVVNNSRVATQICIERSIDGAGWMQIAEEDYIAGGQGYIDDAPVATESIAYRVRNKCDQLTGTDMYSGYKASATVMEKAPPNPPTLRSPFSGSSIALDVGSVRLVWQHNATDGSAQEAAQLRYKVGSGAWTTRSFTTESYYTLDISGRSALDVISWEARTKGAHDDYSPWSSTSTFKILTRPSLAFTSPDNGDVIDALPVDLAWTYSDASGTLNQLTVDIRKDGITQRTINVPVGNGAPGSYFYSLAEFLFNNDSVYSITATALSTSGLSDVSDIAVTISYEEVSLDGGLYPVVSFDDNAVASIAIERDITPDEDTGIVPDPVAMDQVYLYRTHDGERALVASGLREGMQVEDRYAPINVAYEYELLMLTSDGRVSVVSVTAMQESVEWLVYWNNGIARAIWEPNGDVSMSRPEKVRVRYSGRRYPVTYDSNAMEETFGFSAIITEREELNNFRKMIRDGGHGIWKSADGDVYDADFEFTYSADYTMSMPQWNCSLDVTRTDGE